MEAGVVPISSAARTRALAVEFSGEVARKLGKLSGEACSFFSFQLPPMATLKIKELAHPQTHPPATGKISPRCNLVVSAFKACAKTSGSRWQLAVFGEPFVAARPFACKKKVCKKLASWPEFWAFLRSIRVLRKSRGLVAFGLKT